ncbi:hypothetical protein ACFE04_027000 [Oxalis oulophora]
MFHIPLKLRRREKYSSCFLLVSQLSYHKCSYSSSSTILATESDSVFNNNPPTQTQRFAHPQTHRFLRSTCFEHPSKNWQEQRKHRLTASTFAGAIGFWPRRRVQLWLEKLGAIQPFSGNLATCWSNMKEGEALKSYQDITGITVHSSRFQICGNNNNPEDSWLGASPDGEIDGCVYGLPSNGVLEIKCPYFDGDMSKAFPYNRIPLYYIPQIQGLMGIMDRDWMDFYVWTVNGSSLFRINRDEDYWFAVKVALSDFWLNHVQPAKKECSKNVVTDPVKELKSLMPGPRHELYRHIVNESRKIIHKSVLERREIKVKRC